MQSNLVYQFGPFQLLAADRLLLHHEKALKLPPKVFDALVFLVQNNGHVVHKDELMRAVWPDVIVEESSLTRTISVLRKALSADDASNYIETVSKVGYRFVADVKELGFDEAQTAIERLIISRTATTAGSHSQRLQESRSTGWAVKLSLATGAAAVLIGAWFLPSRFARVNDARANSILANFSQFSDSSGQEISPSLSPDGRLIVYATDRAGNWDIHMQQLETKESINLTADSSADDIQPAFSPDGKLIAFRSAKDGGGIFVMSVTGQDVRRIADFGYDPAWSPDGTEIVCAMDGVKDPTNRAIVPSRLWAIKLNSGDKRLVYEGDAVQPQWSPNGHRISYWGLQKGGQRGIWTVSADGRQRQPVTNDESFNWNPSWSPDGKYLYYISDRAGSMNMWRVSIEEQTGRVLGAPEPVTIPSSYTQHISFSRNGKHFAYVRATSRHNIKRAAFDPDTEKLSGEPTWITEGDKHTGSPDLSADGQWIAFDSQGSRQEDIFIAKNDGSDIRQLTNDAFRDRGPRWSPDGKRLAFYSDRGGKYEIWTVNSDGTQFKQLTKTTSPIVFYPVWSHDGSRLVYRTRGNPASIIEVEKLWEEQSIETLPQISSNANLKFAPWSWSSNGQSIAGWLHVPDNPHSGIVLFSLQSKRFEKLTDFGTRPLWLSDDRRLVFFHQDKLYLLDTESRSVKEILSTAPDKIEGISISKDNRMIYFSFETQEADIWLATLN